MDWNSIIKGCVNSDGIPQISCIGALFRIAINAAVMLVGVVSFFLLLVAGIKYITSGGGKQVEEAQKTLTYAIIGLVIVLFSFFILRLIGYVTGVTCFFTFGFGTCS